LPGTHLEIQEEEWQEEIVDGLEIRTQLCIKTMPSFFTVAKCMVKISCICCTVRNMAINERLRFIHVKEACLKQYAKGS
jgi:hypothetical protein